MKTSLQNAFEPQLARFYRTFAAKIFGIAVYKVSKKHWQKFRDLETKLRKNDIPPKIYAETVLVLLKNWTYRNKLRSLPVNVFCGDFAFKRFMNVWKSDVVELTSDDDYAVLYYTERLVVMYYIESLVGGYEISIEEVKQELKPILDERWLEMERKGEEFEDLRQEVMNSICAEYAIPSHEIKTYRDIIKYV